MLPAAHTSPQIVPQMLDGIQVWEHSGQIKDVDGVRLKNKFSVNLDVCARALSCWKINPFPCLCCYKNGTKTGCIISFPYLLSVRVQFKTTSCDRKLWLNAPKAMTLPPPNLSRSRKQLSQNVHVKTVNSTSAVCIANVKPGLIWEHNRRPIWTLSQMLPCPLQSVSSVMRFKL